jgi:hypothetical protein
MPGSFGLQHFNVKAWWPPAALLEGTTHALGAPTGSGPFLWPSLLCPVMGPAKTGIVEEGGQGPDRGPLRECPEV